MARNLEKADKIANGMQSFGFFKNIAKFFTRKNEKPQLNDNPKPL